MILQILLSLSIAAGVLSAQTLALHQTGLSDSGEIEISVVAQLNGAMASGISFYVALPEEVFEVLGVDRPYVQGPLFAPAGTGAPMVALDQHADLREQNSFA